MIFKSSGFVICRQTFKIMTLASKQLDVPAITLVLAIAVFWAIADICLFQAEEAERSAFERIRVWSKGALRLLSVQSNTVFRAMLACGTG